MLQKGLITREDYQKKRAEIAPDSAQTAAERLAALDALFKKGLINKQDYDQKRAQILKEL